MHGARPELPERMGSSFVRVYLINLLSFAKMSLCVCVVCVCAGI